MKVKERKRKDKRKDKRKRKDISAQKEKKTERPVTTWLQTQHKLSKSDSRLPNPACLNFQLLPPTDGSQRHADPRLAPAGCLFLAVVWNTLAQEAQQRRVRSCFARGARGARGTGHKGQGHGPSSQKDRFFVLLRTSYSSVHLLLLSTCTHESHPLPSGCMDVYFVCERRTLCSVCSCVL